METPEPSDEPIEETEPATADEATVDTEPDQEPASPIPNWAIGLIVLGVLVLAAQGVLGWMLVDRTDALGDDLASVTADNQRTALRLDGIESDLAGLGDDLDSLDARVNDDVSVVEPPTGTGTGLPTYPSSGPDPAVGLTIPELSGDDYYTGEATTIGAAEGAATITMVWAHWCPYCQREVPMLQEVVTDGALEPYDAVQLQTVTTFIDPDRPNPLIPYLDELALDYPVVVDTDGSIAAALGMSAVPAWIVTGPDGEVLGRFTGAIGRDAFLSVVEEAQRIATSDGA